MIRVAAVADVHFGADSAGTLRPHLADLGARADVLLVAGDLTRRGDPDEAAILAGELHGLGVPTFAVLGNHDLHLDRREALCAVLERAGIRMLDGDSAVVDVRGQRLGIAGVKGFGVGFRGASCSDFGEPITRAYFAHARDEACRLEALLRDLAGRCDLRIALMHYSPVQETLIGERPEIWAFLGSYLLAEAVDRAGADLALHGHAHAGRERGTTPAGVPVRNVAQPVIRSAYRLFCLGDGQPSEVAC
ncbi:MAG: metallophosphoesterase [Actinobacteria bacterium]|nr:metallophosphoesterase [Actinomycetota bacterium]